MNDQVVINVAAENNRNLNITPLYTHIQGPASSVFDMEMHNAAKRKNLLKLSPKEQVSSIW